VPQVSVVPSKEAVAGYRLKVKLVALKTVSAPSSAPVQVSDYAMGRPFQVSFTAPSTPGLKVLYGVVDPANAPGVLKDANAGAGKALQSAGMFYFQVVDGQGARIAVPADLKVNFGPKAMAAIPEAEPVQGYLLGDQGAWGDAKAAGDPTSGLQWAPRQFGFWNADRNFRTACVKGTLAVKNAGSCKGGRVKASGPDGISSFDTSGSNGGFCLTGAQTFPSQLQVGATALSVQMPANAGDCTAPETCKDIGTISTEAGECGPAECDPACPGGKSCLNGVCVSLNTCAGRCCPGRDDACTLDAAACYCDDYCTTAGDCCPDFIASCH
jgi:hypothetical protein